MKAPLLELDQVVTHCAMNSHLFVFVIAVTCTVLCVMGDDTEEAIVFTPATTTEPDDQPDPRPRPRNCYYLCQIGKGNMYCRCPQRLTCKTRKCSDGYVCSELYGYPRCVPDTSVCRLPKVTGYCKAYIPRYYYNSYSRRCERFIYGGCGGNKNNFKTLAECNKRCRNHYRENEY